MRDRRFYKPALGALVVTALLCTSAIQTSMNKARADLQLTRVTPLENAPPALVFTTVALGGFRGIISNILWMRANELQQESKYFEMVQLADWITKLQPHYSQVWRIQAWNMTYNISVKFPNIDDKWHWIMAGVTLLRDEGIQYNPHEPVLYEELCYFLFHKMGGTSDLAHLAFKQRWAWEWHNVLGETGSPDYGSLLNPQTEEAIETELQLRNKYKMDVRLMKEVDNQYGPLDWRLPETHAIYWAMDGMRKSHNPYVLPLRRVIYQSMQLASRRGKVIENKPLKKLEYGPNVRIIPKANATYLQMMKEDPSRVEHISQGHRNFLFRAIRDLYLNGQREDAEEWFKYGIDYYEDFVIMEGDDVDSFVLWNLGQDLNALNMDDFHNMIKGFIQTAYYDMARGEEDGYRGRINTAKLVRDKYMYWIENPGMTNIYQGRMLPSLYAIETEVLRELFDPESKIHPELLEIWKTRVPNLEARLGQTDEESETNADRTSASGAKSGVKASASSKAAGPKPSGQAESSAGPGSKKSGNSGKPGTNVPP